MSLKFTESTKSTADIIAPVAGGGIAFYYLFKQKKMDLQKAAITAAVIAIVLYICTTQITKRLLAAAQKPPDLPDVIDTPGTIDNNNSTAGGGGSTASTFNASQFAKRLYDDISPFNWLQFGHDETLYSDMVLLSNQNLTAVYNAWQKDYYSKYDNRTLTQAMKDESYPNMINGTNDKVKIILNRLASLGAG